MDQIINVPVGQIFPPYLLLRLLDRRDLAYLELRDSIREVGILNSVCIRSSPRREGWWELIDGMYRWSCAKDLGLSSIPAIVVEADDDKVLRLQLMANAIRAATRPVDFANQMKRLFMTDPEMTFAKLSVDLHKSPAWIKKMLGLLNLCPDLATLTDRSEIPLTSAYMASKLPKWMQQELQEAAIVMPVKEFTRLCQDRLMDYKNAAREERQKNFYRMEYEPHPYLQYYRVLVAEWKHLAVGPTLLVKNNITKPIDAWKLALAWVLHMDPDNVAEQLRKAKERFDQRQRGIQKRSTDRSARFDAELLERMNGESNGEETNPTVNKDPCTGNAEGGAEENSLPGCEGGGEVEGGAEEC